MFDHNITREEIDAIMGPIDWTLEDLIDDSQEFNYTIIHNLYLYRGDYKMAKKYLDMIPNDDHKLFTICNHDFAQ